MIIKRTYCMIDLSCRPQLFQLALMDLSKELMDKKVTKVSWDPNPDCVDGYVYDLTIETV